MFMKSLIFMIMLLMPVVAGPVVIRRNAILLNPERVNLMTDCSSLVYRGEEKPPFTDSWIIFCKLINNELTIVILEFMPENHTFYLIYRGFHIIYCIVGKGEQIGITCYPSLSSGNVEQQRVLLITCQIYVIEL